MTLGRQVKIRMMAGCELVLNLRPQTIGCCMRDGVVRPAPELLDLEAYRRMGMHVCYGSHNNRSWTSHNLS